MPAELEKKYSFQIIKKRNRYAGQTVFDDLRGLENLLEAAEILMRKRFSRSVE
jgi:hypothetical protein